MFDELYAKQLELDIYMINGTDLENLKEKAKKIDISSQPVHIQAVLKSIIDGKKYYLRDGTLDERW